MGVACSQGLSVRTCEDVDEKGLIYVRRYTWRHLSRFLIDINSFVNVSLSFFGKTTTLNSTFLFLIFF